MLCKHDPILRNASSIGERSHPGTSPVYQSIRLAVLHLPLSYGHCSVIPHCASATSNSIGVSWVVRHADASSARSFFVCACECVSDCVRVGFREACDWKCGISPTRSGCWCFSTSPRRICVAPRPSASRGVPCSVYVPPACWKCRVVGQGSLWTMVVVVVVVRLTMVFRRRVDL